MIQTSCKYRLLGCTYNIPGTCIDEQHAPEARLDSTILHLVYKYKVESDSRVSYGTRRVKRLYHAVACVMTTSSL